MPRLLTDRFLIWYRLLATPAPAGLILLVAAAAALSGCSSMFENKYDFREGWRRGEVLQIMDGHAVQRPRFWQCTRSLGAEERAGRRFVVLAYHQVPYRARRHLVAVPPDLELRPGQRVYVNVSQCENAIALAAPAGVMNAPGGPE
jgi:hypothetical protein